VTGNIDNTNTTGSTQTPPVVNYSAEANNNSNTTNNTTTNSNSANNNKNTHNPLGPGTTDPTTRTGN